MSQLLFGFYPLSNSSIAPIPTVMAPMAVTYITATHNTVYPLNVHPGANYTWPVGPAFQGPLDPDHYIEFGATLLPPTIGGFHQVSYKKLLYTKRSYWGQNARQAVIRSSLDGFKGNVAHLTNIPLGHCDTTCLSFDLQSLSPVPAQQPVAFRLYFFDALGADWMDLLNDTSGTVTGLEVMGGLE